MKKSIKSFTKVSAVIAGLAFALSGCSNEIKSFDYAEPAVARNVVSVSDSVSINNSIAAPFGLVADTSTDNLIRLAWGCPSSPVDGWYIYVDGKKVSETTILKQIEVECAAGEHTVAVAAYVNGNRSEAEGVTVTVTGTAASSSADPYAETNSIAAPFGLVCDTTTENSIAVVWGMPQSRPESWAIYLDGNYVDTTTVCTRFAVEVSSTGTHEIGVAAVNGNSRSEISSISAYVTVSGSSGSSSSGTESGSGSSGSSSGTVDTTEVNLSIPAPFGVVADTAESGKIGLAWGRPSEMPEAWYFYLNGEKVFETTVFNRTSFDAPANGTYSAGVAAVVNGKRSEISCVDVTVTTCTSSGSSGTGSGSGSSGSGSTVTPPSSLVTGITTDTNDVLVARKDGMKLTYQFQNCTNGAFTDDEIYIYIICMNTSNVWCYAQPNGTLIPIGDSESAAWQYTLAQVKAEGFQMPLASSGRIYYSYGKPLSMKGLNGGVVLPSLSNPSDPNYNTYFDWLEFTVAPNGFWVNTTQVDQLGFPVLMNVYNNDGTVQQTGISATRESIWKAFIDEMPDEFDTLVGEYRIVAPCKAGFDERTGGAYGSYFDAYVTETWNTIASKSQTVTHPQGKFILTGDGTNLYFKCIEAYGTIASAGTTYTIYGKPKTSEVLEGYGVLASGNPMELALEAWICAALNRHVAHLTPDVYWNDASYYYKAGPCNYFAKFWHDHSERGGLAYGFCYDDVNDQSATTYTGDVRGVVVRLGF